MFDSVMMVYKMQIDAFISFMRLNNGKGVFFFRKAGKWSQALSL